MSSELFILSFLRHWRFSEVLPLATAYNNRDQKILVSASHAKNFSCLQSKLSELRAEWQSGVLPFFGSYFDSSVFLINRAYSNRNCEERSWIVFSKFYLLISLEPKNRVHCQ